MEVWTIWRPPGHNKFENPRLVRNQLFDNNSLPQEKKFGQKVENLEILGVLKNIENLKYNSAENDDFDDKRIWKSEKPARNLLDDNNSLTQEKKIWLKSQELRNL